MAIFIARLSWVPHEELRNKTRPSSAQLHFIISKFHLPGCGREWRQWSQWCLDVLWRRGPRVMLWFAPWLHAVVEEAVVVGSPSLPLENLMLTSEQSWVGCVCRRWCQYCSVVARPPRSAQTWYNLDELIRFLGKSLSIYLDLSLSKTWQECSCIIFKIYFKSKRR